MDLASFLKLQVKIFLTRSNKKGLFILYLMSLIVLSHAPTLVVGGYPPNLNVIVVFFH